MYFIRQYYLLETGKINSHVYSMPKKIEEAYSDLIEAYKVLPNDFIIFTSIPDKTKDELLKFVLNRNKDKTILTIESE